ncbi:hypothetical protein TDB9533_03742 [Thalassocella blandensis]|nr:hypothetical protein TDB9533_03742 [Thalassocella blandensis]
MSDTSGNHGGSGNWEKESQHFLDQGLQDIDPATLDALKSLRQQSVQGSRRSYSKIPRFAAAASVVFAVAMVVYLGPERVDDTTAPPMVSQTDTMEDAEFASMMEQMDMLAEMEMLAGLGELANEV